MSAALHASRWSQEFRRSLPETVVGKVLTRELRMDEQEASARWIGTRGE